MGLCFFDENPVYAENIKKILDVEHRWGAVLYSINFQKLMSSREDNHSLLFLYEELDKMATLYLILIKLDLLKVDDYTNDRLLEQTVAPLLRSVVEGYFKVKYIFSGVRDKNDISVIDDRFKDICRISIDAYNKVYKKALELGFEEKMSVLDYNNDKYHGAVMTTYDLVNNTVGKEIGKSSHDDADKICKITQHNYLKYAHLCLYTHGNLSFAFRDKFKVEKIFGYKYLEEIKKIAGIYVALLRKYGLRDCEEHLLDKQVIKYKACD